MPYEEVKHRVDALLRGVPYQGYKPPEFGLFRGRVSDERLLKTPHEFSYPPRSNQFGRCHAPGSTMFYGALNLDTVLNELAPQQGQLLQVGVAKTKPGQELCITAIGEIDYVRRYDKAKTTLIGNEEAVRFIKTYLEKSPEPVALRTIIVDAFFADAFLAPARQARDYTVTAALSELLLDGKNLLDGFVYPSVAHRGGLNIVLRPERFDALVCWEHFMAFKVTDYLGFGLYGRSQYAKADAPSSGDGTIEWTKCD